MKRTEWQAKTVPYEVSWDGHGVLILKPVTKKRTKKEKLHADDRF